MSSKKIRNIIFDLGGVIINLDIPKTFQHLASLGGMSVRQVMSLVDSSPLFRDYEKGLISSKTFRAGIKRLLRKDLTDQEIDDAWNGMLLDIPSDRLLLIEELMEKYNLFVLSNTNDIHIQAFEKIIDQSYDLHKYHQLFDYIYYSYRINKRKPDTEIYQHVLDEQNLAPEETIFFEDNRDNINGAAVLNIQTHWVRSNKLNLGFIRDEFL